MISAFGAGEVAGSAVAYTHPGLSHDQQKQAAKFAIAERERLGIAHCYPEEEFVRGFVAGYGNPLRRTDGLQLAVEAMR